MAFYDTYVPTEYNVPFEVSDGEHGLVIQKAEVAKTKNKKEMIVVTFSVEDAQGVYIERYVEGDFFNANITKFFDAFLLQRGNFNFESWKRKRGNGIFVHKEESFTDSYGNEKTVTRARLKTLVVPERNMGNTSQFSQKEIDGVNKAFAGQTQTSSPAQQAAKPLGTPEQLATLKALFEKTHLDGKPVMDEAHKATYRTMVKEKGIENAIASCKKYVEVQLAQQTYDIDF